MLKKAFILLVLTLSLISTSSISFAQETDYYPTNEVNTFLTFPEWYVVFSAQENARFLKNGGKPSEYDYLKSIRTFWQSYLRVTSEVNERGYPFSFANHLMLNVVGLSFTGEYWVKGNYERNVGIYTEALNFGYLSEEDVYAQKVMEEYGEFLTVTPWFDFPFFQKITGLWTETSLFGPDMIRKMERKFALTLEYEIKGIYGAIMHFATNSTYAPSRPTIEVEASNIPEGLLEKYPEIQVLNQTDGANKLIAMPHFKRFSELSPELLRRGVIFNSVAQNKVIMFTAKMDKNKVIDLGDAEILFETFDSSDPSRKRICVVVQVPILHEAVRKLEQNGAEIEHLFDY